MFRPPSPSQILHLTYSAYISWNNGRILMFKVSKRPYRSSQHDEIICRWRHNPLVMKIWTKQPLVKIILPLWIKSSLVDRFQSLRCLNNRIDLPHMMGSLASGATNSLVAKIGTKDLATSCWVYRIWNNGRILLFKVSNWPYRSPQHDRIICKWRHFLDSGQKLN